MTNTVNRNFLIFRQILGLGQQEFASRMGLSAGLISGIELGKIDPSSNVIEKLCETYHIKVERLYAPEFVPEMTSTEATS